MKICPKCGKELKDTANFCGGCGTAMPADAAPAADDHAKKDVCPKCGAKLKPNARFCGKCGTQLAPAEAPQPTAPQAPGTVAQPRKDFTLVGGFIHWNVEPGMIAVKIDANDIAAFGKVKGVNVQDGVKALFFVQGKLIAELNAGSYEFKSMGADEFTPGKATKVGGDDSPAEKAQKRKSRIGRFLSSLADHLPGRHRERAASAGLTQRILRMYRR